MEETRAGGSSGVFSGTVLNGYTLSPNIYRFDFLHQL
jgi:hypothetical protein